MLSVVLRYSPRRIAEIVLLVQKVSCVSFCLLFLRLRSQEYLRIAQVVGLGWYTILTVKFFRDLVECSVTKHNFQSNVATCCAQSLPMNINSYLYSGLLIIRTEN